VDGLSLVEPELQASIREGKSVKTTINRLSFIEASLFFSLIGQSLGSVARNRYLWPE